MTTDENALAGHFLSTHFSRGWIAESPNARAGEMTKLQDRSVMQTRDVRGVRAVQQTHDLDVRFANLHRQTEHLTGHWLRIGESVQCLVHKGKPLGICVAKL
jgi:hypothetical protein